MNKRIIVIITFLILLITSILLFFSNTKNLHEYELANRNTVAVLIYNEETEQYIKQNSIPSGDYELDEELSYCTNRGEILDYNSTLALVNTFIKSSSECYFYFKKAEIKFTSQDFSYTGTVQTFTIPVTGTYKLEVWGAQGGTGTPDANVGGKGGYSVGNIKLTKDTILYIYVGQSGSKAVESSTFGGGGKAEASSTYNSGQGGGASDFRIGQDSLYARVIVAGGGGGGAGANESTYAGGYGGGETGGGASANSSGAKDTVSGATQTAAGNSTTTYNDSQLQGSFGTGGYYGGAGTRSGGAGGGGWYGGGAGSYGTAGSGGSGYVYTSSTASNYPSGCLLNSSYYMTSASTSAGNTSFTSPTGTNETGHSGNGFARITFVSK